MNLAQQAAANIVAKMHNAIDYHLDKSLATFDKESLVYPLKNDGFITSCAWEGFRHAINGFELSLLNLCNIKEEEHGGEYEQVYANQLTIEFRNYVTSWFEFRDEVAAVDGQAAHNFEHEKELSVA